MNLPEIEPERARPERGATGSSRKAAGLSVLAALGGLALLFAASRASAGNRSLLLAGALVLLLGCLRLLRRSGPHTGLFSVKVPPRLFLLAAGFWLGVVLSEIALRLFFFQSFADTDRSPNWGASTLGYQYDRVLGWFPIPHSQSMFSSDRRVVMSHNSRGLRDIEPELDSRPGVLFLGDSFVWGFNVEASERFTEKLRAAHPEWRVFNVGVCGYSTDQEYLMLQQHFAEYHPRIVFLIFCTENDDLGNCANSCEARYFKPYFVPGPQRLKLHGVPVPRSERAFCLEHPILSRPYVVRLVVRAYGKLAFPPPHFERPPTIEILRALKEYVSARGAAFYVGLTGSHPTVEAFLKDAKIPYVDLTTDLRVEGDVHWSPEGHTYVANRIDAFLAKVSKEL